MSKTAGSVDGTVVGMDEDRHVVVYGANGHTGRYVVAELCRRGWVPVLAGRNRRALQSIAERHGGLEVRPASIDSPRELDAAVAGNVAVLNCAGPLAATTGPVVEAALGARIPYLDVAAEIEAVADTFARFDEPARAAGVAVVPAMAFFGALGDLLATAAVGEWPMAEGISIAYGLDSWHPTSGTRAAGEVSRRRRSGLRVVHAGGRLRYVDGPPPAPTAWDFPAPLGTQQVRAEFTMADSVTIARHIPTTDIHSYMTMSAVRDISDGATPPPVAADGSGRSAQSFLVDVVAHFGGSERRASAAGRDIYAFTAPLLVEALERVVAGGVDAGAFSAGEAFDAASFLRALPLSSVSLQT